MAPRTLLVPLAYNSGMDIVFGRGSQEQPKGHALLYFRTSSDPDEVWVTYLVILPISVDVSKYVPPFLMNQVAEIGPKDLSAFAFPPAPERLGSYAELEEMAVRREDDILYAGTINPTDVASAMMAINEAVQQYASMYAQIAGQPGEEAVPLEAGTGGLGVSEVLYGLMNEGDRLGELTKLVGRLRFAVEGSDPGLVEEAEEDINLLAVHLPDNHGVPRLIQAVKSNDSRGAMLADLYLQRCFHLVKEEYVELSQVEEKIKELEREGTSASG